MPGIKKEAIIENITKHYQLKLLLLFGSRVSGKIHRESDYDIAYLSRRVLDLDEEGSLILDLLPIVKESDERLINLVNIKKAMPLLLYAMTSRARVLYESEPTMFAKLRAYAFKKYIKTKTLY